MLSQLLSIADLELSQIHTLLQRASDFKTKGQYPAFPNEVVANLFFENSTRTRVSFELAAKRLGMTVINLEERSSSAAKGEALEDTLLNLKAMGIRNFVLRHAENGLIQQLAHSHPELQLINAGDGTREHPSQALLDMMTILERKPQLSALKVAILGNIRHSRVAHSFQALAQRLQIASLNLIAPKAWQDPQPCYGQNTDNLAEGLAEADVVICLRVQKERLEASAELDLTAYCKQFALTETSLAYAKKEAIVLHPGPINRGLEIDSAVADGPQSCILQQVSNGVFMRMAILEALAKNNAAV